MLAPGLNPDKGRLHAEAETFEYVASLQVDTSLLAPRRLQAEAGVHSEGSSLSPQLAQSPPGFPPVKWSLQLQRQW